MTAHISIDFDGGNIRVAAADGDRFDLEIANDHQSDFYQWFHFRLTGAKGREVTMRIVNAGGAAYPGGWTDYRAWHLALSSSNFALSWGPPRSGCRSEVTSMILEHC